MGRRPFRVRSTCHNLKVEETTSSTTHTVRAPREPTGVEDPGGTIKGCLKGLRLKRTSLG